MHITGWLPLHRATMIINWSIMKSKNKDTQKIDSWAMLSRKI